MFHYSSRRLVSERFWILWLACHKIIPCIDNLMNSLCVCLCMRLTVNVCSVPRNYTGKKIKIFLGRKKRRKTCWPKEDSIILIRGSFWVLLIFLWQPQKKKYLRQWYIQLLEDYESEKYRDSVRPWPAVASGGNLRKVYSSGLLSLKALWFIITEPAATALTASGFR